MASSVTLAQLRTDARLYADQRLPTSGNPFITEAELTRLVNGKVRELYDLLVEARGLGYYTTNTTISIVGGEATYDLPSNFYELEAVILEWDARYHEPLDPAPTNKSRAWFASWPNWARYSTKAYKLNSTQIEFLPLPAGSVTARIYYVPTFPGLANDSDTFDGINGWEKMVTIGVAKEMREIEKRPSPTLDQMYAEQMARIIALKDERDAESPKQIIDVQPEGRGLRRRRLPWENVFDDSYDTTFD